MSVLSIKIAIKMDLESLKTKDEMDRFATSICFCCSLPAAENCSNFKKKFDYSENIAGAYQKVTGHRATQLLQGRVFRICHSCLELLQKAQEFFKLCNEARTQKPDDFVKCIVCRLQNLTLYQIKDKFIDQDISLSDGIKKWLKLKKHPSADSKICEPCFMQFETISFFRTVCLSGRDLTTRRLKTINALDGMHVGKTYQCDLGGGEYLRRVTKTKSKSLEIEYREENKADIKLESDNSVGHCDNFDDDFNRDDDNSLNDDAYSLQQDSDSENKKVVETNEPVDEETEEKPAKRRKRIKKKAPASKEDENETLFPLITADSLPPSTWIPRRRAPNRKVAKTTFCCALCPVKKAGKFDLKCHLFEAHFPDVPEAKTLIRCNYCAKMHVSKEKHLLHITRYHTKQLNSGAVSRLTPEPFLCNICGKKFVTSQSLNYHFDVHSTGRKYKCEFEGCTTAYRHPRDLNRHRRDFHTGGTFKCPHCRRYFTTLKRLEVHKNLIHKQDNWICEHCGRSFETRMRLMKHEYRHKGYNPFNCTEMLPGTDNLCNYTTATKSCFAQHLMARHGIEFNETIHTRPIPEELAKHMYQQRTAAKQENMAYRCTQPGCTKGFQTSTGLHHHLKMHQNIMYKCRLCPKQFTQKPALWEHSFTHQNFSPFECANFRNSCDYKSNAKRPFVHHLKTKHNQIYSEEVHGYKRQTFQQVMDFILG